MKKGIYLGIAIGSISTLLMITMLAFNSEEITLEKEPSRDVYYPGTEELGPDEMRVVALGTGMPNARPKQAAASFLVELGNGDKFIFDAGTGSAERLSAQEIPYDLLDKVFIGHLHADHFGDLDAIWIGGVLANRQVPLRIWGPSGSEEKLGTKYAVEHMKEMYAWDWASRQGNVNTSGFAAEVTEFDYKKVNNLIYDENGVQVYTIPAIHAVDGPVSFILKWNGLKFAFSSDTYPNKWWIEHTQDSDIAIHECFSPPSLLVQNQEWPPLDALNVATQVHTSPAMFGKVMSDMKPRLAVAYHFFNDFNTAPKILEEIQLTYDGPVSLATDYMVWNITKDDIKIRMSSINEDIWPLPSLTEKLPADPNKKIGFSEFTSSGRVVYEEVIKFYYDETNELFGTDYDPPK
ncbi:guanitoxin biosynthesis MBL fold metallo-hydrolase GntH [Lutimonas sp.]|uniref:guanitoxin biosynthesis MBL fold metallo-hydrolase GntH n=1 Tax=Lutimonas sp. TaxID=1872403 RepID=UPI003D9BD852